MQLFFYKVALRSNIIQHNTLISNYLLEIIANLLLKL